MKGATQEPSHKPVFHGFLLSNGTSITPTEMEIMESLGVVRATKTWTPEMNRKRARAWAG